MPPLSTINYFLKNKRKLLSNIVIIVVAICLVYVMECFVSSIAETIYSLDATRFEYASVIVSTEAVPEIPTEIIISLEESENVETVIPVTVREIVFSVPGSTTHAAVFSASDEDLSYLTDTFEIEVIEGRLPKNGFDEIAVDESVAKNNNLEIGSRTSVDTSHNLNREYTVVGILSSHSHISFVGSPTLQDSLKDDESGYLVFPTDGHFEEMENEVSSLNSQGINVWTLTLYDKMYAKNNQTFQILDIMVILAIVVMVVCLVCSKYAQFFSRKSEFGILNAIGYTRKEISKRIFREVIITNLIGFVLGLLIAILLCKVIVTVLFDDVGGTGVYLYWKAVILSLIAPVLTSVFTLFPVNRLIKKIDAVSIVTNN